MMRRLLRILVYVLLMMGSGVLIWTLIPENQEKRVLTIGPEFTLFSEKMKCEEVKNLLISKFTVINSRSIRTGESGEVQVDIDKAEFVEISNIKDNELDTCGLSLEVWINGADIVAEPGDKIITPFLNVRTQTIKFDLFPKHGQKINSTIWISAIFPVDNKMIMERIPIFAVPLIIQVHSLFGLSTGSLRILLSSLIFLALVLLNCKKYSEIKRK